jgi:hypothetical protein
LTIAAEKFTPGGGKIELTLENADPVLGDCSGRLRAGGSNRPCAGVVQLIEEDILAPASEWALEPPLLDLLGCTAQLSSSRVRCFGNLDRPRGLTNLPPLSRRGRGHRPGFGHQQSSFVSVQIYDVSDPVFGNVHPIDGLREFPNQPNPHLLARWRACERRRVRRRLRQSRLNGERGREGPVRSLAAFATRRFERTRRGDRCGQ